MWEVNTSHANERQILKYLKHHRSDFRSCWANLMKLRFYLNAGVEPRDAPMGFLHPEGVNLMAIGNKRTPSSRETRLYIYMDHPRKFIQILGIGDKSSQKADIARYQRMIQTIKQGIE